MTKRFLIYALALVSLAACYKIERGESTVLTYEKSDDVVDFSWYSTRGMADKLQAPVTRADTDFFVGDATVGAGTQRHLNAGTSFGVFGYFHPQIAGVAGSWNDANNNYPNLFYNEQVSIGYNNSTSKYEYDYANDRYWPRNSLDRISFLAYYPWNELNTSGGATENTIAEPFLDSRYERDGMVGFYYVVPEKSEDQIDFCVSDLCTDQSKALWESSSHTQGLTIGSEASATDKSGTVKFFFHHALSQVRVKSVSFDTGGNADVDLTINYIVFKNVAVFGQCIPVPDFSTTTATGRTTVTPTWPVGTLVGTRPNGTKGVKANVCFDSSTSTWDVSKFLLMIPHTFFTGAAIEVNFDVSRHKDAVTGEYYNYENNTLSAPLTTDSVYAWETGKIYTYNITLDLKQIKVKADVTNWLDAGEDVLMDN